MAMAMTTRNGLVNARTSCQSKVSSCSATACIRRVMFCTFCCRVCSNLLLLALCLLILRFQTPHTGLCRSTRAGSSACSRSMNLLALGNER